MRGALFAGLLVVWLTARSFAQPAEPDFARATELYNAATAAMNEGRNDDAARDFLAAYDITKDAVLFFKIGSAYEKAGKCGDALGYYQRYLDEAKPAENFVALTRDRIDACRSAMAPDGPTEPSDPSDSTPPAEQPPAEAPPPADTVAPVAGPLEQPSRAKDAAWLLVGGSLVFVTAGAVLAYSTSSAEKDLQDLYVSQNGQAPEFDAETRKRYDDIMAEGRRYEVLSWTSFGVAAGCAVAATILFVRDHKSVTVAPVVTPNETGVAATLRF